MVVATTVALAHHRSFTTHSLYYADRYKGQTMACGGAYRPSKMVAAHRSLPCGTRLRVRNVANDRVVRVTVRDRGPFGSKSWRRSHKLDVSKRAARRLGFLRAGSAKVRVTVLHD
ncbi:MAG: septal ring lytic transglycosylase RlpA family protein [Actinomycetota bacterium]